MTIGCQRSSTGRIRSVTYGLHHPIKYARLIVRQASSPHARGADASGQRYFVQLILDGVPVSQTQTPGRPGHGWAGSRSLDHCHRPARGHVHAWRCCAPSWHLTPERSAGSSARWNGNAAPATRPTTMPMGESGSAAKAALDLETQQAVSGDPATQGRPERAQARRPSQESPWPPRP